MNQGTDKSTPTRVVQITDLHLQASEQTRLFGVDTAQTLRLVVAEINALPEPAQLVIATGDLADDGSHQAYSRLAEILAGLAMPVYLLPGNHDDPAAMQQSLTGDNLFWQPNTRCGNWEIILVDSKKPGSTHGLVSATELAELESRLQAAQERPVLVALHHSPASVCTARSCHLHNAPALLALLQRYDNVKALIGGHTHTDACQQLDGLTLLTTPSSYAQFSHSDIAPADTRLEFWDWHQIDTSRHGFRVLDLYADGALRSEVHWGNNPVADSS